MWPLKTQTHAFKVVLEKDQWKEYKTYPWHTLDHNNEHFEIWINIGNLKGQALLQILVLVSLVYL